MVKLANGGQRTPSGTLAHFLAADYIARSDYRIPHLKSKDTYLSPDEQVLARSDYLRPNGSPKRSTYLTANEITLAKSDYLRPQASPNKQPRSSLSLKADSVEVETRCKTLRPRVKHQSYSYSVHTLRRQARALSPPFSPPCDCLPMDPIPPPELFDFWCVLYMKDLGNLYGNIINHLGRCILCSCFCIFV